MAYRKEILKITYHFDDDTNIYKIGSIDCGLGDDLINYNKKHDINVLIHYLENILPRRIRDFIKNQEDY